MAEGPDLALELHGAWAAEAVPALVAALRPLLTGLGADPDVRLHRGDDALRLFAWSEPGAVDRVLTFDRFACRRPGEGCAAFLSAGAIGRLARRAFADPGFPRRLNADLQPDPGGAIRLTEMTAGPVAPASLVTRFAGQVVAGPLDGHFSARLDEGLAAESGRLRCRERALTVDTVSPWLRLLSGLAAPWTVPADLGLGRRLVSLCPAALDLPGRRPARLAWERVQATEAGLRLAGGLHWQEATFD